MCWHLHCVVDHHVVQTLDSLPQRRGVGGLQGSEGREVPLHLNLSGLILVQLELHQGGVHGLQADLGSDGVK